MKVKSLKPPLITSLSCISMKKRSGTSKSNAWLVDIKDLNIEGVNLLHPAVLEEEVKPAATRWNPTQEQIEMLERLYASGVRTPNAEKIQHITSNLRQYGRIEGKNVFYWFQNHKARQRQRQKRYSAAALAFPINSSPLHAFYHVKADREEYIDGQRKRRNTEINQINKEGGKERTLVLFPLHPEGW